MAESIDNKQKKNSRASFKLDAKLQEAMRRHIALFMARGERAPSRGDLLWEAWKCYEEAVVQHPKTGVPKISTTDRSNTMTSNLELGIISLEEQKAIAMLLSILRSDNEVRKTAIMWNLRGWAEPIGVTPLNDQPRSIPEAIQDQIQQAEALSANEAARRKWVEDLSRLLEEYGEDESQHRKSRKTGGKRGA